MRIQDSRFSNIQFFYILISHFDLRISRLPDIVQKYFCTQDGAMDPTLKTKYIPRRFMFNLMEILIIKQIPLFFEAPCMSAEDIPYQKKQG